MSSPITCHVLNTLSGTPASELRTTLSLFAPVPSSGGQPVVTFHATTNSDGRVEDWQPNDQQTLQDVISGMSDGEKIPWSIRFEVGAWYESQGIESFWPEVEVKFYVKKGERHYHVPVLVGPWTYTTYRGS